MAGNRVESFGVLEDIINNPRHPVAYVCQAIDECISCNFDNLRGFFEGCFPLVVKSLFGLDGPSWLSTVAQDNQSEDARALVQLLAPKGNLLSAMDLADRDGLIQYVFPEGRLPVLTQIMLKTEAGQEELEKWPQYQGRLVHSFGGTKILHLNTLQYFLLWTAFYVLRSGQSTIGQAPMSRRPVFANTTYGSLRKRVQAAGNLVKGQQQPTSRSHPYQTLLQQYLAHYLPQGGSSSMGLGSQRGQGGSAGQPTKGELLFSVLTEFWLTDGEDPALRNPKQDRPLPALPYEAPTDDLLEAMQELVRYVLIVQDTTGGCLRWAQGTHRSWLPLSPVTLPGHPQQPGPPRLMAAGQAPFQSFARRLYRFMRRAITKWPEGRSTAPLVSLYLAIIAPWGLPSGPEAGKQGEHKESQVPLTRQLHNVEGLVHRVLRDKQAPAGDAGSPQVAQFQIGQWEGHVLAMQPFYQLLFPMMLTTLRSRITAKAASSLRDTAKILTVFKTAPELCTLLRAVEEEYRRAKEQHTRARLEGPHADVLPWIQSQVQAFEAGATASVRDSHVAVPEPAHFLMFSSGERGGAALVHSLLTRAVGASQDALKQVEDCAQGWLPMTQGGEAGSHQAPPTSQIQPELPTVKQGNWQELQFKGDPMHRPVTSREFRFLVRWLVWLSVWLNSRLGLDKPVQEGEMSESLVQDIAQWMRRRKYRVNLRYLAEAQTLGWLVILWLSTWGFYRFCRLIASIDTSGTQPRPHTGLHAQQRPHRPVVSVVEPDHEFRYSGSPVYDDF